MVTICIGYQYFTLQGMIAHMDVALKQGVDMTVMQVPRNDGTGTKTVKSMFKSKFILLIFFDFLDFFF